MDYLYAPWRSKYVQEQVHGKQETTTQQECVFCSCMQQEHDTCYIVHRGTFWFIILNRFPYNAGHLLIVPYTHTPTLMNLSQEARYELSDLEYMSIEVLQKVLSPDGYNLGLNIGKAAGAGIPSHLHQHVLPRWHGDTNFLPILSETRHISCDLNDMYKRIKKGFAEL